MHFRGTVMFRSSRPQVSAGPPGEAEIQRLNPNREQSILNSTGWQALEPGSLNLNVGPSVVRELGEMAPALVENAEQILYPPQYSDIPRFRQGYWYYRGSVRRGAGKERVLVRRPVNPTGIEDRVELFAATSLKAKFRLAEGDTVDVHIE
jgi:hypothetical protein